LSLENDVKLTDEIEIKAVVGLLFLAGALQSNSEVLEELWGSEGGGTDVPDQMHS